MIGFSGLEGMVFQNQSKLNFSFLSDRSGENEASLSLACSYQSCEKFRLITLTRIESGLKISLEMKISFYVK